MKTPTPIWICIALFAGLSACAYPISKEVMWKVDKKRTYSEVMKNPEEYIGTTVLWGGVIEQARVTPGRTRLIVNEASLNSRGYPQLEANDRDFVALTSRALDPQLFRAGRKVTLVGEIESLDINEFGGENDIFPVLRIVEIHVWAMSVGRLPISKGWEFNQFAPPPEPIPP